MAFNYNGLGAPSPALSGPGQQIGIGNRGAKFDGYFSIPTTVQRMAEQTFFSTQHIVAGAALTQYKLFSVGQNQAGQGFAALSDSETNVTTGGANTGDVTFDVSAIACEVLGGKDATTSTVIPGVLVQDMRTIQRCAVLSWAFGGATNNSLVGIAPLSMVGAGGGAFGMTADTGTPVTQVNNGNGGIWLYQKVVIVLPAFQTYYIAMNCGNAGTVGVNNLYQVVAGNIDVRVSLFNQVRQALAIA